MENTVITGVEIIKLNLPYKEPFVISLGVIESASNIVIKIHTNSELTGAGECAPFVTIVGETQETVFELSKQIAKLIKGKDPFAIEKLLSEIDRAIFGNYTMKSAFDMALYDLLAKKAQLPLYKLLGGSNNREIYTDMTISIGSPRKVAND
ncbi:MAG TPA: dipeptide epimerase, partial [Ignavibacteria bacterium]|nr:dipeptide epimerase [Ignavibacteria bacterium]